MPELPEVETVRRRLAPRVEGRVIAAAELRDPRLVQPVPVAAVEAALAGRRVERLERRGKYLLARLAGDATLVVHLRMTGNLLHLPAGGDGGLAHVRAVLALDDGTSVVFSDVRRFGTWDVFSAGAADAYLDERLGPEPLGPGFSAGVLRRAFAGRTAPVKAVLLDQSVVAGVGNIYADEALWRARIHPATQAGLVSAAKARRLTEAVREVLELGIASQGASIRDYRTPTGGFGSMQERFSVFDRDGEPCPSCGREIIKTRVAGRGTHLCPGCQRRRGAASSRLAE